MFYRQHYRVHRRMYMSHTTHSLPRPRRFAKELSVLYRVDRPQALKRKSSNLRAETAWAASEPAHRQDTPQVSPTLNVTADNADRDRLLGGMDVRSPNYHRVSALWICPEACTE